MGNKADAACLADLVNQDLRVGAVGSHFASGAENEQMVLGWLAVGIVDFLADEHEQLARSVLVVSFHSADMHVVVGDDDHIQPSREGCAGQVGMRPGSVRIGGVHVEIQYQFGHFG